jgi:predicted Ser/Thr protein kinase
MPHLHDRIDRYEVQEVIGRGAMGVVYRARDPLIGRVIALKTILLPDGNPEGIRHDTRERFAREARAAGLLSHPNIVTIYDVGEVEIEGSSYIAMEYVEGRTLRDIVPHGEKMSPVQILEIAQQVARALDYAHRRGIIHRDVKPANILVRDDGLVKLADFGVAHVDASELTRTGQSVGSPSYISPDVLLDRTLDGRSDLFSLGVILYEVLTGEKPFRGETLAALYHQIISSAPKPPSAIDPEIPQEWDAVILKLLAKSPGDRYASAAHLLEDLRCLELGKPLRFAPLGPEVLSASAAPELLPEPIPDRLLEGAGRSASIRRAAAPVSMQLKAIIALLAVAGFALTVILVAALLRRAGTDQSGIQIAAAQASQPVPAKASLTVRLSHGLKDGRLAITMDGASILSQSFHGERGKLLKMQGALSQRVQVTHGRHVFRVTVSDDEGRSWSGVTTRNLDSGTDATLFVEVKGLLKKSIELTWY